MRIRAAYVLGSLLTALLFGTGCSKPEAPKPAAPPPAPAVSLVEEGKALFEAKCSVCHGLDRSTARTETKEQWAMIIKDMQGKKANWISDDEAGKILEFLAATHGK